MRDVDPSGRMLGAEVRGIDLSQPLSADDKAFVEAAWTEHLVLLFREQRIGDEHLLALAEALGGAQAAGSRDFFVQAGYTESSGRISALPGISLISNLDENGRPVPHFAAEGELELQWHTDNSYVENPPKGSILHALQVPVNGGGHTLFANQYAAYDSLPAATRARLDGLNLVHDSTRNTAGRVRPTKKLPTRREEVEGPVHPLVRLHPESGRRALYLGRRCPPPTSHVVELSDAESDALLDELWTNATRDEFVWGHDDWRPGDVLMWDNRCTLHTRTRVDNTRPRLLHRTLIRGEAVIAG